MNSTYNNPEVNYNDTDEPYNGSDIRVDKPKIEEVVWVDKKDNFNLRRNP